MTPEFRRLMFVPSLDTYKVCDTPAMVDTMRLNHPEAENVTGKDFHESRLAYVLERGPLAAKPKTFQSPSGAKYPDIEPIHVENCGCPECSPIRPGDKLTIGQQPVPGAGVQVAYDIRTDSYEALSQKIIDNWIPSLHGPRRYADGNGGVMHPVPKPTDTVTIIGSDGRPVQRLIGQDVNKFREIYDAQIARAMEETARAENRRLYTNAQLTPDVTVDLATERRTAFMRELDGLAYLAARDSALSIELHYMNKVRNSIEKARKAVDAPRLEVRSYPDKW